MGNILDLMDLVTFRKDGIQVRNLALLDLVISPNYTLTLVHSHCGAGTLFLTQVITLVGTQESHLDTLG